MIDDERITLTDSTRQAMERIATAPATRLALHPDGTLMVSIGQAAPLAGLGRLAADPNHSRSVMSPAPEPAPEGLTDEELEDVARTAEIRSMREQGGLNASDANGIAAQLQVQRLAGLRAVFAAGKARRPTPQPPADGEVAQLVAKLCRLAPQNPLGTADPTITRAAELLQHQHPQPVTVSERLPEPSIKVLAHYFNALGKGRTICAIWVPAKSRSDDADFADDDFTEYNEEDDKFYWPEGWYEAIENWDDLGWVKVDEGEVIYWQPLPKWPATALPLPSGEVE